VDANFSADSVMPGTGLKNILELLLDERAICDAFFDVSSPKILDRWALLESSCVAGCRSILAV
jgi:hypothetical protein